MAYLDDVTNILEIRPSGLPTVVRLSQNENGRRLYFRLIGNETAIPSGSTVTISGTKPDGVVFSASGSITNDVVLINESTQMTAVAGTWDAKIKIVSSGQTIATGRVRFEIDADPVAPGSVPSDSELEGLVAEAQAYAENARSSAYGSPLTASTVAGMTDPTRVYVYTGSETGYTAGNWYYWNGTAWTSGGVYNSIALQTDTTLAIPGMAADAKATGDAIDGLDTRLDTAEDDITDLKSDLAITSDTEMTVDATATGWRLNESDGLCSSNASYKMVKYAVTAGDELKVISDDRFQFQTVASVPSSGTSNRVGQTYGSGTFVVTVPETATYLIVSTPTSSNAHVYEVITTVPEETVQLREDLDDLEETVSEIEPGLSSEAKEALMACFAHVKWSDDQGQDYYDDLYNVLYGIQPDPEVPSAYTRYDWIRLKQYSEVPSGTYANESDPALNDDPNVSLYKNGLLATGTYTDLNQLKIKATVAVMPSTLSASKNSCAFGGGSSSNATSRIGTYFNMAKQWIYVMMHGKEEKLTQTLNDKNVLEIINGGSSPSTVTINGTSHSFTWTNSNVINTPISYFVAYDFNTAGNVAYAGVYTKVGDIEIKNQSDELVSKLIPVVRKADNVIGIWDSVREAFYTPTDTKYSTIGNSSCVYAVGSWDN